MISGEVAFEGDRTFFDTNTSNHFHYYLEEAGGLVDIGTETLEVKGLPDLPPGTEIDRIDIIVRLKKTDPSSLPLVGKARGWESASPAASHPPPLAPPHEGEGD